MCLTVNPTDTHVSTPTDLFHSKVMLSTVNKVITAGTVSVVKWHLMAKLPNLLCTNMEQNIKQLKFSFTVVDGTFVVAHVQNDTVLGNLEMKFTITWRQTWWCHLFAQKHMFLFPHKRWQAWNVKTTWAMLLAQNITKCSLIFKGKRISTRYKFRVQPGSYVGLSCFSFLSLLLAVVNLVMTLCFLQWLFSCNI